MEQKSIKWQTKSFDELTIFELYELLKLRAEVFIMEQQILYQDLDDLDKRCFHLLGWSDDGNLAAYARLIPVGVSPYKLVGMGDPVHGSMGRVLVSPAYRGIGHELVREALAAYDKCIGKEVTCIIHAQAHLQKFYESHGFKQTSRVYQIENIDHIEMTRIMTQEA